MDYLKREIKMVHSEKQLPPIKLKAIRADRNVITKFNLFDHSPELDFSPGADASPVLPRYEKKLLLENISPRNAGKGLRKKVYNLMMILKYQEKKINSMESELSLYKPNHKYNSMLVQNDLESSELNSFIETESIKDFNAEKSEQNLEFYKTQTVRSKHKDMEIMKLKKIVKEKKKTLKNLENEKNELSGKLFDYDFLLKQSEAYTKQIKDLQVEQFKENENIQKEISKKVKELNEKCQTIEELSNSLKNSEIERSQNNEYNISIESSHNKLVRNIYALESENNDTRAKISGFKKNLAKEKELNDDLSKELALLNQRIDEEVKTRNELNIKYENAEAALQESISENIEIQKKIKSKYESFNEKELDESMAQGCLNVLDTYHQVTRRDSEDSLIIKKQCNSIENTLAYSKKSLEKLKKTEIFLRNQLSGKDLHINQIEKRLEMIRNKQKGNNNKSQDTVIESQLSELSCFTKKMIDSFSEFDLMKCIKCSKIVTQGLFLVPCGHLTCTVCWRKKDLRCTTCFKEVANIITSQGLNKLFSAFCSNFARISKLYNLLKQI